MFVTPDVRRQVVTRFFRGSFSAKKLCAHVVVDPKDARAVSRETPHAFRANQSRSTCNDERPYHGYRSTATIPQSSMSPRPRKDSLARREIAGRLRAHSRLAEDFSTRRRETKCAAHN